MILNCTQKESARKSYYINARSHPSQEGFANFIEMNRGYYGTVERGEANVTVLNLLKILKGLNVTPNELFPPATYSAKEKILDSNPQDITM